MSLLDRHETGDPASAGGSESTDPEVPPGQEQQATQEKRPLYPRLLHLQHIHPNAWQRAVLGEGAVGLAALLVLADLATAWTLLVLPVAVAAVVKGHDMLAGMLGSDDPDPDEL